MNASIEHITFKILLVLFMYGMYVCTVCMHVQYLSMCVCMYVKYVSMYVLYVCMNGHVYKHVPATISNPAKISLQI